MNTREILSTPGPITGVSKRACVFWTVLAVSVYLATLYAVITWNTLAVAVSITLFGPFIAMIPAGIQAYQNGSVVLSLLLTFAPVLGLFTRAYARFGDVGSVAPFLASALFAGATAHLLGFEFSKPRQAAELETRLVAGLLVLSGVIFIWIFRDILF